MVTFVPMKPAKNQTLVTCDHYQDNIHFQNNHPRAKKKLHPATLTVRFKESCEGFNHSRIRTVHQFWLSLTVENFDFKFRKGSCLLKEEINNGI